MTSARVMKRMMWAGVVVVCAAGNVSAIDQAHREKAEAMIDSAIKYLKSQQDSETGGWAINPQGPNFPAITGLVVTGMLMDEDIDEFDPSAARGIEFMLSMQQEDGGIYDKILPSYNTSICVSALTRVKSEEAKQAVAKAIPFLKGLQWGEGALGREDAEVVDESHPYYGGVGYGGSSRPDNSNLNWFMQALQDAGVPGDDPAVERALVFLSRTQMLDEVNDMPYADGSKQGGFVYATSPNREEMGRGESKSNMIEETMDDGTVISRLRAYGSMTYAGFKSYLYANLKPDDVRVSAALEWIQRNYTVEENPGIGTDGLYYYYVTFARALDAFGKEKIQTQEADGSAGEMRDWANDLIDRLAQLQNEDGSFKSVDDRWMENNPILITAYSLMALQEAVD